MAELMHVTLMAVAPAVPDAELDAALDRIAQHIDDSGTLWSFGRFDSNGDELRFELDGTYDLESAEADAREAGTDPTDEAAMTAYLRHWLTAQAQDALRGIDGARVDDATLAEQPA